MASGELSGNPAGWISAAIKESQSARGALRDFRAAGGRIGNDAWFSLFGQVRAGFSLRPDLAGMDPNLLPDDAAFSNWSFGKAGQRLYQVDIYVRPVGSTEPELRPFSFISDEVVAPWEAITRAVDMYDAASDEYEESVVGGVLSGLYNLGVS